MNQIVLPHQPGTRAMRDAILLLLAGFVTLGMFLWQGDKGLNLPDEGFFWYGVQRVLSGEVPIRDFMAYDPGRYYWSAAILRLLGTESLLALRATAAIFQMLGVYIALRLLDREADTARPVVMIAAAVVLNAWFYPWFKVFDMVPSIALVAGLAFAIERPSPRRLFIVGLIVGLAAIFGRNHGVYGLAGSVGIMLFLTIRRDHRLRPVAALTSWAAGIAVGFLPIPVMALAIPGFGEAFWQSIVFLVTGVKGTNIPLPVPWPWLVPTEKMLPIDAAAALAQGAFFVLLITFGILTPLWALVQRWRGKLVSPALVASGMLALPYAHYAFSRADIVHLAQGIFPMMIGSFALLLNRPAWVQGLAAIMLGAGSLLAVLPVDPGWQCHQAADCVKIEAGGSDVLVSPRIAQDVTLIEKLGRAAGEHSNILVLPFWPGAYALLQRRSPTWETYALFPRSAAFEQTELARIRAATPTLVMINDAPLDEREELRFHNTHPLIYQYVMDNYELVKDFSGDPWNQVYKLRQTEEKASHANF
ncbi:hypothetical protein [Cupriavidus pampae]|uniref:Glycosyltransferase RgtA/B/C/D-like domain-containing protein n=1 Tax=Cupriavidus pampae TaxID=659251 RepID=A0ABM8WQA9_9BURK|nr:hypothetical protein [Cupriavidus pampae]CAG9169625.1 hypothetical protein LMG32289_01764 [Cupriavidus pampae]